MCFSAPLLRGRLVRRYKRFFADVDLDDGARVVAHVPNTGSMMGLAVPGVRVWLAPSHDPKRTLKFTWEMVEVDFGAGPECVGIHTGRPNGLVAAAITSGLVPPLAGYAHMRREVKYGVNSRIDLLLEGEGRAPCYVEVKNVHLMRTPGLAEFPDCATARGVKHLAEMSAVVAAGGRAVLVFLVQIGSARAIDIARDIDPAYGIAFDRAMAAGVEALAIGCRLSSADIVPASLLPIVRRS